MQLEDTLGDIIVIAVRLVENGTLVAADQGLGDDWCLLVDCGQFLCQVYLLAQLSLNYRTIFNTLDLLANVSKCSSGLLVVNFLLKLLKLSIPFLNLRLEKPRLNCYLSHVHILILHLLHQLLFYWLHLAPDYASYFLFIYSLVFLVIFNVIHALFE